MSARARPRLTCFDPPFPHHTITTFRPQTPDHSFTQLLLGRSRKNPQSLPLSTPEMNTNSPASTAPPRPVRRRQRAALTCLECRRRKVKCDRKHPCRQCVAAQVECTYSSTFDKARALPKQPRDARPAISKPTTEPEPETVASPCSSLLSCSSSPPPEPRAAEPSLDEGATPIWPQLLANGLDAAKGDKKVDLHRDEARHEATGPRVLLNKTRMPTSGHVLGAAPPVCPSLCLLHFRILS